MASFIQSPKVSTPPRMCVLTAYRHMLSINVTRRFDLFRGVNVPAISLQAPSSDACHSLKIRIIAIELQRFP